MNNVESPQHYTQGYLEVIYIIEQTLGKEGFKAFCMGNWINYQTRAAAKNGQEDLDKAQQYLEWAQNGLPKPVDGRVPRKYTGILYENEAILPGNILVNGGTKVKVKDVITTGFNPGLEVESVLTGSTWFIEKNDIPAWDRVK